MGGRIRMVIAAASLLGFVLPASASVAASTDEGVPTLTIRDTSSVERFSRPKAFVTLRLSEPARYRISAQVEIVDGGTATKAADYYDPGTLHVSFRAGQTEAKVGVIIRDDREPEPDETILLEVTSVVGAVIGDGTAEITIVDDDEPPRLGLSAPASVGEGGNALIPLSVERPASSYGSVKYELIDGTAKRGEDYTYKRGAINYSPAKGLSNLRVRIRPDQHFEGDETFVIRLFNPKNMELSQTEIEVTIEDNDAPPSISISDMTVNEGRKSTSRVPLVIELDRSYSRPIALQLATSDGTALAGVDYRPLNKTVIVPKNKTTVRVPLRIIGNLNPEDDEYFTVDVSTLTPGVSLATPVVIVTIVDDD